MSIIQNSCTEINFFPSPCKSLLHTPPDLKSWLVTIHNPPKAITPKITLEHPRRRARLIRVPTHMLTSSRSNPSNIPRSRLIPNRHIIRQVHAGAEVVVDEV